MERIVLTLAAVGGIAGAHAQTYERYVQGNEPQMCTAIDRTADGGYILAGWTQGYGVANGFNDVYLIRTDGNGDTLWTRTFGGNATDEAYSVRQTDDGGFLVAGGSNSFGVNGNEFYVVRTDENGDPLWNKTYGGPGEEIARGLALTSDGGAIIVGQSGTMGGPGGGLSAYAIRINASGDTLWTRTYDTGADNYANSVSEVDGGDHILAGRASLGAMNMEIIRIHDNGDVVWNKAFSDGNMEGYTVVMTSDLGFIACGQVAYDACLVKLDAGGALQWAKSYGGPNIDYGYCVREVAGGGYVFSGEQFSHTWLVRTNASGDTLWHHTYATGNATVNEVVENDDGGFSIGANRTGIGGYLVQLVRTNSAGDITCDEAHPATDVSTFTPTEATPTVVISTLGEVNVPTALIGNGGAVFTACTTVDVPETMDPDVIRAFPSPATGVVRIDWATFEQHAVVRILDATGRVVLQRAVTGTGADLNVRDWSAGGYMALVTGDARVLEARFIVAGDR
jgi:hypothetical protein